MTVLARVLYLVAAACAIGWFLGVPNSDVGSVAAAAVALLLGDDDSGGPRRRP